MGRLSIPLSYFPFCEDPLKICTRKPPKIAEHQRGTPCKSAVFEVFVQNRKQGFKGTQNPLFSFLSTNCHELLYIFVEVHDDRLVTKVVVGSCPFLFRAHETLTWGTFYVARWTGFSCSKISEQKENYGITCMLPDSFKHTPLDLI